VVFDASTQNAGRERVRLDGAFPLHAEPATYRRRIENPSLAAGYATRAALEAAGIHVSGNVSVDPTAADRPALASHESAPLSALLYEVGKDSNNFYAEMTLLAIGAGDHPSETTFAHAVERERAWLHSVGVDDANVQLRNGSGLFDANRVSPTQLAEVLRAALRDPAIRDEYIAQLAVGGDDGTLERRIQVAGADRWVRAKTGTLDDVIALSGYVLSPDPGRTLVFSVLANGVRGHQAEARRMADRIATELVIEQQRSDSPTPRRDGASDR
jgi:D-alanyl-D-alanine carboxypeptidase/D-alanyl-D-alanine-endopeptidase (penicillin-binding protein 4)